MTAPVHIVGRYALYGEIAAGGMATVHFGRLLGPVGFSRTVAIKRLHPQYAKDPEFVAMFLDEARLAARIRHPNVVQTLDVVATDGELFLVMDYIQGESLSRLARRRPVPPRIAAAIISGVLHGLHAAHEARNERGEPLNIVHRDISPQNILIGVDGSSRVLDFGVAKASGRSQTTREGHIKGKLAYMAPEQFRGAATRQTDVYATAIVAWEVFTGERLFAGADEVETLSKALNGKVALPSSIIPTLVKSYDDVILKGLSADPAKRYATAREMAIALERCDGIASPHDVGEWVDMLAKEALTKRQIKVSEIESSSPSISQPSNVNMYVGDSDMLARDLAEISGAPVSDRFARSSMPTMQLPDSLFPGPMGANPESVPPSGEAAPLSVEPSGVLVGPPSEKSDTRPPLKRHPAVMPAAVAALVVLVFFALRPLWHSSSSDTSVPAHAEPSPTPNPVLDHAVAPLDAPAPPAAVSTSEVAAAPPIASVVVPVKVQPHTPSSASRPQQPPPPSNNTGCDPPFTIDTAGHKHYKEKCL